MRIIVILVWAVLGGLMVSISGCGEAVRSGLRESYLNHGDTRAQIEARQRVESSGR